MRSLTRPHAGSEVEVVKTSDGVLSDSDCSRREGREMFVCAGDEGAE